MQGFLRGADFVEWSILTIVLMILSAASILMTPLMVRDCWAGKAGVDLVKKLVLTFRTCVLEISRGVRALARKSSRGLSCFRGAARKTRILKRLRRGP